MMIRVMMTMLLLSMMVTSGALGEAPKIAVVDMARVLNTYPETDEADAEIDDLVAEFEEERKDLLETYQELKTAFTDAKKDAQSPMWSDEERARKEEAATEKLTAVRDHERKIRETSEFRQKQIADQRMRLRQRIIEKLHEIVDAYAAKNGYDLVLDGSEGVTMLPPVIYRVPSLDITDAILKITLPEGVKEDAAE